MNRLRDISSFKTNSERALTRRQDEMPSICHRSPMDGTDDDA